MNEFIFKSTPEIDRILKEMIGNRIEKIVRCKDCKYWHKDSETELNFCLAFHDEKGGQIIAERDADDFCSRGVKKDD